MRKRVIGAALALSLLLPGCGAAAGELRAPARPSASPLPPITREAASEERDTVPVYLDGLLAARGCRTEDALYLDVGALCNYAGIAMDWSGDGERFTLTLDGLRVEGKRGQQYYTASGRYVYAPEDWLVRDGRLFLPEGAVCKLLNLKAAHTDGGLQLNGKRLRVLEGGAAYYDLHFAYDDLYWLSHIIGSEAGIEPMEGKIGVGNVVMNRVADADFPDTVFGVVYDYEHTIQFEPISRGTIHDDPKPEDIIAACLVLEGASTAGDCLYFVNPEFGSFWFDNNLSFVMKLGRHNFYVRKGTDHAGTTAGTDPAAGT